MSHNRSHSYLDRGLDTLKHSQAHDGPGRQQTADDVSVERARFINRVCDIQRFAVPEIRCGGALFTFFYCKEKKKR